MARNIRLSSSGSSSGGVTLPLTASFVCLRSNNFFDSQNRKINNWVEIACCVCWTGGAGTTTCFNYPFCCYSDVCFYLAGQGAASCVSTGCLYFLDRTNGAQCNAPIYHFLSLSGSITCKVCCYDIPLCSQFCSANIVSGRFFPNGGNYTGIGIGFNIFPGYDPGYCYVTPYTSRGFIPTSTCVSWDRLCGFAWVNSASGGGIYPGGSVSNAMFKFYGIPCV